MNYFEFYVGDYARDTAHLSLAEHGSFLLLLAAYYGTEKPLAADLGSLYRIARAMNPAEQKAVKSVAEQFFPVDPSDGLRHNARADEIIAKALVRIDAARSNGGKGGRPKKPSGNPPGFNPITQAEPTGKAHQTPDPKELEAPNGALPPTPAGADVPDCPHAAVIALYHECLPSLRQVATWGDDRQRLLRTRWREAPERQCLDWWRELFAYVAKSDFLMGRTQGRDGPFDCDLEWLIRPKNFAKLIEGKYENRSQA